MSAWAQLASAFCRGRKVPRTGFKQLTSKIGPRNFYKGKGCASTGRLTKKGRFILEERKLPQYIVPDLQGFKLKPYVSYEVPTK